MDVRTWQTERNIAAQGAREAYHARTGDAPDPRVLLALTAWECEPQMALVMRDLADALDALSAHHVRCHGEDGPAVARDFRFLGDLTRRARYLAGPLLRAENPN